MRYRQIPIARALLLFGCEPIVAIDAGSAAFGLGTTPTVRGWTLAVALAFATLGCSEDTSLAPDGGDAGGVLVDGASDAGPTRDASLDAADDTGATDHASSDTGLVHDAALDAAADTGATDDASSDTGLTHDAALDGAGDTGGADAGGIACGDRSCGPAEICVHVCDCCGVPTFDGGPQPSGHDECVPDRGQCQSGSGSFATGGHWCSCYGREREADCPCA